MSSKPFPWKCSACHEREVTLANVHYVATVEHDGRPYDLRIDGLQIPKCRNCGKLVMTEQVNQKISDALRKAAHLLTPAQIRKKRDALGLTQKQLAAYLQVADATLSRWETGAQIQQRSLDRFMRLFFEVPEARAYLDCSVASRSPARQKLPAALAKNA